jgi:hypothetical protein
LIGGDGNRDIVAQPTRKLRRRRIWTCLNMILFPGAKATLNQTFDRESTNAALVCRGTIPLRILDTTSNAGRIERCRDALDAQFRLCFLRKSDSDFTKVALTQAAAVVVAAAVIYELARLSKVNRATGPRVIGQDDFMMLFLG